MNYQLLILLEYFIVVQSVEQRTIKSGVRGDHFLVDLVRANPGGGGDSHMNGAGISSSRLGV